MHELALAQGILRIVEAESAEAGFNRVQEIHLQIGALSDVIPACLEEAFPLLAGGSPAEGARLVFKTIPATCTCPACEYAGAIPERTAVCPQCGSNRIRLTAGREFYVDHLVVE